MMVKDWSDIRHAVVAEFPQGRRLLHGGDKAVVHKVGYGDGIYADMKLPPLSFSQVRGMTMAYPCTECYADELDLLRDICSTALWP